jgi:ATP-dependent DNA helicase RecG
MEVKLDSIKGIGPQTLRILRDNGIWSAYDLVSYLPKGYEDFSIINLNDARHKDVITVLGKILTEPKLIRGGKVERLVFKAEVLKETLDIVVFGRSYLLKQIQKDDAIQIKGTYDLYRGQINASSIVKAEKRLVLTRLGLEGLQTDRDEFSSNHP